MNSLQKAIVVAMSIDVGVRQVDFGSQEQCSAVVTLLECYAKTPAGGTVEIRPEAKKRLPGELASHPTALTLLAWVGKQPVGLAICFGGYSTFMAKPVLNLHDLVVHPDWRGKGVGGRLLEAVEEHAQELGCGLLTLEVIGENQGAQRLYRRHGFQGGESITPSTTAMFFKKRLTADEV